LLVRGALTVEPSLAASTAPVIRDEDLLQGAWLVEVRVLTVRTQGGAYELSMRIEKSFLAPEDVLHKTFNAETLRQGSQSPLIFGRALEIGEKALWLVRIANHDITSDPSQMQTANLLRLPAVEKSEPPERYAEALKWAGAVEKVGKADPEKRIGLLRDLCTDSNPPTAAWAIKTLAKVDFKGHSEFLQGLLQKDQLPIKAQLALDEVLARNLPEGWTKSPQRLQLFKRWVASPRVADAPAALPLIEGMYGRKELSPQATRELLNTAIKNENMPPEDHNRAARLLRQMDEE
jgi:hypothetical protein